MNLYLQPTFPLLRTTNARTWWSPKKKKRSTLKCYGEIASAKSFEAHVARWCAEFHHYPRVGDCAEGSKQLRGRARAQFRGNIACNYLLETDFAEATQQFKSRIAFRTNINSDLIEFRTANLLFQSPEQLPLHHDIVTKKILSFLFITQYEPYYFWEQAICLVMH